jgi:hypothetical protein
VYFSHLYSNLPNILHHTILLFHPKLSPHFIPLYDSMVIQASSPFILPFSWLTLSSCFLCFPFLNSMWRSVSCNSVYVYKTFPLS